MGKHFIDPKSNEILSIFKVFYCMTQIAVFDQNCSLPLSLRSLDIPALLKSEALLLCWRIKLLFCKSLIIYP
jgi:hypothetical protein